MENTTPELKNTNNTLTTKKTSKVKLVWNRIKNVCGRINTSIKKVTCPIGNFIKKYIFPVGRFIANGIIIALVMNIITVYFWPELPDTIPTIYEFFNGFLVFGEYLFKAAFGGLASIFNGSFFEFSDANFDELCKLWNAFWSWAGNLKF